MSINSLIDSARSFFGTQSRLRERMLSILKGLGKEPLNSSPERILFYCDHENYKIPVGVALVDKETILLAEIYLKSDHDTVDTHLLSRCLKDQGLM